MRVILRDSRDRRISETSYMHVHVLATKRLPMLSGHMSPGSKRPLGSWLAGRGLVEGTTLGTLDDLVSDIPLQILRQPHAALTTLVVDVAGAGP